MKKIVIILTGILCFVNISYADIFVATKDTKVYINPDDNKDFVIIKQGDGFKIAYIDKDEKFAKLDISGTIYKFVLLEDGIIKKDNTWTTNEKMTEKITLTPEEEKRKAELERQYDENMAKAWGGIPSGTPLHTPSSRTYPQQTKEFICREAVNQAMEVYYKNRSAFRDTPTLEFWNNEYKKCMNR